MVIPPIEIDRHWFLTWATYGSRLPGDGRGTVSNVRSTDGMKIRENRLGMDAYGRNDALHTAMEGLLKCSPIVLDRPKAEAVLAQLLETAAYRRWELCAAAVMRQHIHVVVGVCGDPRAGRRVRDVQELREPKAQSDLVEAGERYLVGGEGIDAKVAR